MPNYKNKVRVRACGLLVQDKTLLLVELFSPVINQIIWTSPGGGVEFGETIEDTVKREFFEETGLHVKVEELLYVNELIKNGYHALEFYYKVEKIFGELSVGMDPEYPKDKQILKSVAFKTKEELLMLKVTPEYLRKEFWENI